MNSRQRARASALIIVIITVLISVGRLHIKIICKKVEVLLTAPSLEARARKIGVLCARYWIRKLNQHQATVPTGCIPNLAIQLHGAEYFLTVDSTSQDITSLQQNPKVHYRVNNRLPLYPITSQLNTVHFSLRSKLSAGSVTSRESTVRTWLSICGEKSTGKKWNMKAS